MSPTAPEMTVPLASYLLNAIYGWITDNGCTPYVLVNARASGVDVPASIVRPDGKVILNLSMTATHALKIESHGISLSARFGQRTQHLYIPCHAVEAIYARENGAGMMMQPEYSQTANEADGAAPPASSDDAPAPQSYGEAMGMQVGPQTALDTVVDRANAAFAEELAQRPASEIPSPEQATGWEGFKTADQFAPIGEALIAPTEAPTEPRRKGHLTLIKS